MFRYLACGGFNTVISILISWYSYYHIVPVHGVGIGNIVIHRDIAAFIIAFSISFPLGFIFSKYLVFPESNIGGKVQAFRYVLLVATCVGLNYVLLKLFVEAWGFNYRLSTILIAIMVATFSYFPQRMFTFKVNEIPAQEVLD